MAVYLGVFSVLLTNCFVYFKVVLFFPLHAQHSPGSSGQPQKSTRPAFQALYRHRRVLKGVLVPSSLSVLVQVPSTCSSHYILPTCALPKGNPISVAPEGETKATPPQPTPYGKSQKEVNAGQKFIVD